LVLTLSLPYLPFAAAFGLVPLPVFSILLLLGIVTAYIVTADLLKVWFFRHFTVKH
jgi:P-type Mg2+ transporter